MIEEVTILLLECFEQKVEPVLFERILITRRPLVHTVPVLQGATRQNGQPDAEHLRHHGIHMGRIGPLGDQIMVDLLRRQVHIHVLVLPSLQEHLIVAEFSGEGGRADDLDLSALVDEDVARVDVADLPLEQLELAARPHHVVQQVPDLGLEEVLVQLVAVLDLGLEDELVVVEGQLGDGGSTLAMPLDPHSPTLSKECLMGSRITSLL